MKIGLHTRIKNPLSLGYYVYLASVKSWLPLVDRLVVVDGGSTDGSIKTLLDWCNHDEKIEIIQNCMSFQGQNFSLAQSTLNMQIGHERLTDFDWIIRIDADHVIHDISRASFEQILIENSKDLHLGYDVFYFRNGYYYKREYPRGGIINNNLIIKSNIEIGWGKEKGGMFSDNPIFITDKKKFRDIDLDITKIYNEGSLVPIDRVINISVYRYGHFFFTKEQCLKKVMIWQGAISRSFRIRKLSKIEKLVQTDTFGIYNYLPKRKLLNRFFPETMLEVINKYYVIGMLGGAKYLHPLSKTPIALLKIYRHIYYFLLNIYKSTPFYNKRSSTS